MSWALHEGSGDPLTSPYVSINRPGTLLGMSQIFAEQLEEVADRRPGKREEEMGHLKREGVRRRVK